MEEIIDDQPSPWYRRGLRFSCVGCGKCCTAEPGDGVVWTADEEIDQMAGYLRLNRETFMLVFMQVVAGRLSLGELPNGDCHFLDPASGRCRIYPVRPKQCRNYPFWPEIMHSPAAWEEERLRCPGLDRGRLWSCREIREAMRRGPPRP
ncbi:MAG: YkgJ family cysteine cluster protein [Methanosarcinales archaeon]|nr:YkgJ family cysteine cluster protein [Methanosarcinales archaeon]